MKNDLTKAVFGKKLDNTITVQQALQMFDDMGLLNIGELAELAISKKSGIERCKKQTENIDLVTGVQIKHAKTHLRPSGKYHYWGASISRNTTAPILAVITEQHTKKQYFLHIPYHAHKHMAGNTINVWFGADGTRLDSHWLQDYAVDSFAELCELAK